MKIEFITYIAAVFVVLLEIAMVVLLISRKENRSSGLYRCTVCFAAAVLAFCLLYFYFYFQDVLLRSYAVGLPLRILDYLLDAGIFFFWLRLIGLMSQSSGKSNPHVFVWSWIIGLLAAATGIIGTCMMDEYYCFSSPAAGNVFTAAELMITLMTVVVTGFYTMQLIRYDTSRRHRLYVGFVSTVLCLWTLLDLIVCSFLYTGQFVSAWAEGIPDTTAISVFIIGLATFLFVFQEDFSPLFYAAADPAAAPDTEQSGVDASPAVTDLLERAAVQHGLTVRELDVLRLVYEGKNNPEIAEALFISRNTVKKHLQNIYEKFGVNSRMELVYIVNLKGK